MASSNRNSNASRAVSKATVRGVTSSKRRKSPSTKEVGGWTFLTNHAHVLILLSQEPSLLMKEIAHRVGITERAVQRIVADLESDGYIHREKIGRQNHYRISKTLPLKHPIESHRRIGDLLRLMRKASRRVPS